MPIFHPTPYTLVNAFLGHSGRKSQYPTRIRANSQKNEGCWIEIQFERAASAKFWSLHLARPRRERPADCWSRNGTQKSREAMPHTRTLLHFAVVCVEGDQKERAQPTLLQPRGKTPQGVGCKKRLAHVAHQNPSPGAVESWPLYNRVCTLRFCTHSVSGALSRLLVCDLKASAGQLCLKSNSFTPFCGRFPASFLRHANNAPDKKGTEERCAGGRTPAGTRPKYMNIVSCVP